MDKSANFLFLTKTLGRCPDHQPLGFQVELKMCIYCEEKKLKSNTNVSDFRTCIKAKQNIYIRKTLMKVAVLGNFVQEVFQLENQEDCEK